MSILALTLAPVAQTPSQLYRQLIAANVDNAELPRVRDACLLVATRTRHLLRGCGKPFACHLFGVASLVAEATGDLDLVVVGLLHALPQQRVRNGAWSAADARIAGTARVLELLRDYDAAGELRPDSLPADVADRHACDVRTLQLADRLEDGLDGGPWWHGNASDAGDERGSGGDRVAGLRALSAQFALAPAMGAPMLLTRFNSVMVEWDHGHWPPGLRSGWYTSHAPSTEEAL